MQVESKKDVIYRCIGTDFSTGIIACGYMPKPTKEQSQYNLTIDYYSCFFVLSGNGIYSTNSGRMFPMHSGDFVQRMPGVCHTTEINPDGQWLEFFISFGKSTYDYLCSLKLLPIKAPVMKAYIDLDTLKRFSKLLEKLKEADDSELPFLSLKAQELVLSTIHQLNKDYSTDSYVEVMEEACRVLSSEIQKSISLENLASSLNMSYENFRKQFRKYSGISPSRYRIEQRMKHAKLMILSGIPIKETAQLTGYNDTYSFTKQFTQFVGTPPGRYRTSNQAKY